MISMAFLFKINSVAQFFFLLHRYLSQHDNFFHLTGIITEEYLSEEELQEASAFKPSNFVGVVFNDAMSYQLRFPDTVAMTSVYTESRGKHAALTCTP